MGRIKVTNPHVKYELILSIVRATSGATSVTLASGDASVSTKTLLSLSVVLLVEASTMVITGNGSTASVATMWKALTPLYA